MVVLVVDVAEYVAVVEELRAGVEDLHCGSRARWMIFRGRYAGQRSRVVRATLIGMWMRYGVASFCVVESTGRYKVP